MAHTNARPQTCAQRELLPAPGHHQNPLPHPAALRRRFNFEAVAPIADADAEAVLIRRQAVAA
ncbi:hypothetical protein ACFYXM_34545, partial [Streptomyces sp. NPDC002476]|uniref:hypothetical protein n=1 Tax=Streptomyces sp. NPDC002476 TaxID=3364648 RepID=UPI003691366F